MVIGFLLLIPFLISQSPEFLKDFALYILLASWMIGKLYWALSKLYLEPKFKKKWPCIFGSNNIDWINQEYIKLKDKYKIGYRDVIEGELSRNDKEYLKAYYRVQKNGLLGTMPILESYSEFFKNMIVVLTEWILFIVGFLLIHCLCYFFKVVKDFIGEGVIRTPIGIIIALLLIIGFLGALVVSARKYTEKKIYYLILEADLLGVLENSKKESSEKCDN